MSLDARNPYTILLVGAGMVIEECTIPCSAAITPGNLIELHSDSGVLKWRKNASATEIQTRAVALSQPYLNKGIDTDYAAGDLVNAAFIYPGCVFYGLIPSGQNISVGEYLQSNGDGKLKSATATTSDANLARFQSLDGPGSVTVDTRIRVQVI